MEIDGCRVFNVCRSKKTGEYQVMADNAAGERYVVYGPTLEFYDGPYGSLDAWLASAVKRMPYSERESW